MLRTTYSVLFITLSFLLFLSSCGDSVDFREQWVGTYEGTKSNRGFDDEMFRTDITFDVLIDEVSEDGLIVNGINFPISEDGTYGPDFLFGSTNYTLSIDGDDLRLEINVDNVLGLAIPCFILAEKI